MNIKTKPSLKYLCRRAGLIQVAFGRSKVALMAVLVVAWFSTNAVDAQTSLNAPALNFKFIVRFSDDSDKNFIGRLDDCASDESGYARRDVPAIGAGSHLL